VAGDLRAEVLSYGAHLVGLSAPDRTGRRDDVVVSLRNEDGSVDVDGYRDPIRNPHLGGMVGRFANRIAAARFDLDGVTHQLVANEGPNQLHGGPDGFDRREWDLVTHADDRGAEALLRLRSDAGDQGYPGCVEVEVRYRLELDSTLQIDITATCDAATPLSITNHTYWNLAGTSAPSARTDASIAGQLLSVAGERVVQVDDALLPTGELVAVEGTHFDLRAPTPLGSALDVAELSEGGVLAAVGGAVGSPVGPSPVPVDRPGRAAGLHGEPRCRAAPGARRGVSGVPAPARRAEPADVPVGRAPPGRGVPPPAPGPHRRPRVRSGQEQRGLAELVAEVGMSDLCKCDRSLADRPALELGGTVLGDHHVHLVARSGDQELGTELRPDP
jgi:galactose mutarotase-like enzyme